MIIYFCYFTYFDIKRYVYISHNGSCFMYLVTAIFFGQSENAVDQSLADIGIRIAFDTLYLCFNHAAFTVHYSVITHFISCAFPRLIFIPMLQDFCACWDAEMNFSLHFVKCFIISKAKFIKKTYSFSHFKFTREIEIFLIWLYIFNKQDLKFFKKRFSYSACFFFIITKFFRSNSI